MVALPPESLTQYIRYFEDLDPGVPQGYTGWYHSYGAFALRSSEQAFQRANGSPTPVRPEVAGPFTAHEDALADLMAAITTES